MINWRTIGVWLLVATVIGGASPQSARAQDPLTAVVDVDANTIHREIPRGLYSTTIEWEDHGNGILDPATNRMNGWLWLLSARMKFEYFRFPGGILSDYYFWPQGIGPQAARPMTPKVPGTAPISNAFGTMEALIFAALSGGELLITVNAGTGSAEMAASWVKFVNGIAGPLPPQQRVKVWEVGNELYTAQAGHNEPISIPPDVYAERFLEFAAAMRAADPTIEIMGLGGKNAELGLLISYPDWNETVLTQAGSEMDYLAVHNAYYPGVFFDDDTDFRTVYAALLGSPRLVHENLADQAAEIATFAPGSDIKLAVTEWNALFHVLPTSPYIEHTKTMGSALYVALILKAFIETPTMEIANFFTYMDPDSLGSLGPRDGIPVPKPNYMAMELFSLHFGSQHIASTTTSPTYDTQQVGVVPAMTDVPYLESIASLSDDGNEMYIMLVNKHFDDSILTWIQLDGFVPEPNGTVKSLLSTGMDANTGTQMFGIAPQAEDPLNPRFNLGGPGEVQIWDSPLQNVSNQFLVDVPAHSMMSLKLTRATP